MRSLILLAFVVAAAAQVNPACPAPSTGPISCLKGVGIVSSNGGGACVCSCGANAATASPSDNNGNPLILNALNNSACTPAACRNTFPSVCMPSNYVSPIFMTWAAGLGLASAGATPTPAGSGAICSVYSLLINQAVMTIAGPNTFPLFALNNVWSVYEIYNATTAAAQSPPYASAAQYCAAMQTTTGAFQMIPGAFQGAVRCNTNNCNVALPSPPPPGGAIPSTPSYAAAPRIFPVFALVVAVVALAL